MNYKFDLILMYTYLYTAFKTFDNAHIRNDQNSDIPKLANNSH